MEKLDLTQIIRPKQCFCHVPAAELKKWAIKRYCEQHSTLGLLVSTDGPHDIVERMCVPSSRQNVKNS
jgi:hypothetical protein